MLGRWIVKPVGLAGSIATCPHSFARVLYNGAGGWACERQFVRGTIQILVLCASVTYLGEKVSATHNDVCCRNLSLYSYTKFHPAFLSITHDAPTLPPF